MPVIQGVIRSLMPILVLDLIAEQPRHGLEIGEFLQRASGGAAKPSSSTLHALLQKLEDDELIVGEWQKSSGAPRRLFKITTEGKKQRKKLAKSTLSELELASLLIQQHLEFLLSGKTITSSEIMNLHDPEKQDPMFAKALEEASIS